MLKMSLHALFDLHAGTIEIEGDREVWRSMALLSALQTLQAAFEGLVKCRDGKPLGMLEIEELVEGFRVVCVTGRWTWDDKSRGFVLSVSGDADVWYGKTVQETCTLAGW